MAGTTRTLIPQCEAVTQILFELFSYGSILANQQMGVHKGCRVLIHRHFLCLLLPQYETALNQPAEPPHHTGKQP